MSRGLPAVWSAVFGAPFVAAGTYVYAFQSRYPLTADGPTAPPVAGVPLVLFGLFVVGLGLYVRFAGTPGRPTMREGERVVAERTPAQRSALAKAFSSVPFLAGGLDLLYFTARPLVYPTVALVVGFYLFSTGVHEYWRNTLTRYVLTNRRVMEEYRFVSLVRNELPLEKVRAVRERRSALDALFGLGDVRVRAGATGDLSVTVRAVYESTEFADEVRREMGRATGGAVPDEGDDRSPTPAGAAGVASDDEASARSADDRDGDGDRTGDAHVEASPSVDLDGASAGGTSAAGDAGAGAVPAPDDRP